MYFWTVAREGGVAAASRRLRLSQSSISTQLRQLEEQLGQPLFDRSRRRMQLTEAGQTAFRYADEIFGLGREMVDVLQHGSAGRSVRLALGLTDTVQKMIAYRLIEPALQLPEGVQIHCEEDRLERLLPQLASHELDLVVSDEPLPAGSSIKAFNHPLGHSKVTIFAAPTLAGRLQPGFPASLDGAPFLPTATAALRRDLDRWFDQLAIRPRIVGEFDDSALLKVFGQAGAGAFGARSRRPRDRPAVPRQADRRRRGARRALLRSPSSAASNTPGCGRSPTLRASICSPITGEGAVEPIAGTVHPTAPIGEARPAGPRPGRWPG
nr:LysR family transcriptional regulator [Nannocystis pusilla]